MATFVVQIQELHTQKKVYALRQATARTDKLLNSEHFQNRKHTRLTLYCSVDYQLVVSHADSTVELTAEPSAAICAAETNLLVLV